jgi:hypothetical protein
LEPAVSISLDTPHLPTASLSLPDLAALVESAAADPGNWRSQVRFGHSRRHWSRLPAPDGVDLWLLTWLPDQSTELHDHGASAAALTVVDGCLTEIRADRTGARSAAVLPAPATQLVAAGVAHDIVNRSAAPAVSIHGYSPPLTVMTFWAAGPGGLRPVRSVRTDEPEL